MPELSPRTWVNVHARVNNRRDHFDELHKYYRTLLRIDEFSEMNPTEVAIEHAIGLTGSYIQAITKRPAAGGVHIERRVETLLSKDLAEGRRTMQVRESKTWIMLALRGWDLRDPKLCALSRVEDEGGADTFERWRLEDTACPAREAAKILLAISDRATKWCEENGGGPLPGQMYPPTGSNWWMEVAGEPRDDTRGEAPAAPTESDIRKPRPVLVVG